MCSHGHQQHGDPALLEELVGAVDGLRAELDGSVNGAGDASAALARAASAADAALGDENPWTRGVARGLRTVVEMHDGGRPERARELLYGELSRSLPGRAELGPVMHLLSPVSPAR